MKKQVLVSALVGLTCTLLSCSALADWATKVEDDAFSDGQTAMMFGAETELNGVAFDCTKTELTLSYVEQADTKKITEGIPVDMVFKVDGNNSIKLKGRTTVRNNNYFGITSDDAEELKNLLAQLQKSKQRILVGIKFPFNDQKMSFTLSASGSTSAVNKFVKACSINISADKK